MARKRKQLVTSDEAIHVEPGTPQITKLYSTNIVNVDPTIDEYWEHHHERHLREQARGGK